MSSNHGSLRPISCNYSLYHSHTDFIQSQFKTVLKQQITKDWKLLFFFFFASEFLANDVFETYQQHIFSETQEFHTFFSFYYPMILQFVFADISVNKFTLRCYFVSHEANPLLEINSERLRSSRILCVSFIYNDMSFFYKQLFLESYFMFIIN